MDTHAIVKALKVERDRLNSAITALEETDSVPAVQMAPPAAKVSAPSSGRGHRLTPEGRKRLSENMKKRWAAKRKRTSRGGR